MNNHRITLFNAFARGIQPEQKMSIAEWAAKYVTLARSSRSEKADLTQTPYLIAPLEAILGNEYSEIVLVASPSSGKTTLLEIALVYIVAEKPGPTLVGMLANQHAQELMETGIMPALRSCSLVKNLFPKNKNSIRKNFINFAHMPLWVGGSNLSNFTSKSCDNVFLDECWKIEKGLIKEAKKRTHNRWGSKFIGLSQAGYVKDDLDEWQKFCHTHEYAYFCPHCKTFHPYIFDNLKFTRQKNEAGLTIWDSLEVYYECPCGARFEDTIADRRALTTSGAYLPTEGNNPLAGKISFHYNAMAVFWITWKELVIEFLKANEAKKAGDFNPLRTFYQSRLALAWDEDLHRPDEKPLNFSDYTLAEAQANLWEVTLCTVDVQKDRMYYVVRTWTKAGESRLVDCGMVINFGDIEIVRTKYNLKPNAIFIDTAARTHEVKTAISQYKWRGLNGRPERSWLVTDKRTNKKYQRIYSEAKYEHCAGKVAINNYYSSNSAKDILFLLKGGNGCRWELPVDISDDYKHHLNAEYKLLEGGKTIYKTRGDGENHYLDCEAEMIIGAIMWGVYPQIQLDSVAE